LVGLGEAFLHGGAVSASLRRKLFGFHGGLAEIAGEGDGEDAHVGSEQFALDGLGIGGRIGVEASGKKDDGLLPGTRGEPVDGGGQTRGEIEFGEVVAKIDVLQRGAGDGLVGSEI